MRQEVTALDPCDKEARRNGQLSFGGGVCAIFLVQRLGLRVWGFGSFGVWRSGPLCRAGAGVLGFMVVASVLDKEAASQTVSASVAPDSQSL